MMNGHEAHPDALLDAIARRVRLHLLEMHHRSGAAHLGSSLSCVDILVALYFGVLRIDPRHPDDPTRDRFILSKGHAASVLYAVLAERGFFPVEELGTFGIRGGRLPEQPAPRSLPGVEAATGSLGHGLPIAAGLAKAAGIHGADYRVFALLSDGECNEGSVWEAAMFAPAHRLSNLTAIIDHNRWQATGRTDEVLALAPLAEKWRAFGWNTIEADGHDIRTLRDSLQDIDPTDSRPTALIAHTVKGKGVSFMQDDNNWHYRSPNEEELRAARAELIPI